MIRSVLLFCSLFMLSSCSSLRQDTVPVVVPSQEPESPYSVSVEEERYDGKTLYLSLRLDRHSKAPLGDLVIRLTSFKDGQPEAEQTYVARDLISDKMMSAAEPIVFPVAARVGEMTDYQLELLWGSDARQATRALREDQNYAVSAISDVTIQNVTIDQGTLYAVIQNRGHAPVMGIILRLAFLTEAVPLDFEDAFQQNGEEFTLSQVRLLPSQQKKLKIVLDPSLLMARGEKPFLKLLPYERAQ